MLTEPLNVVQKSNLLSQVKYLCSHIQTVMFGFGLERLFGNTWAGKHVVFICPSLDSYEYLSVQHPPWMTLYSIVLPLILKDQVEEW